MADITIITNRYGAHTAVVLRLFCRSINSEKMPNAILASCKSRSQKGRTLIKYES